VQDGSSKQGTVTLLVKKYHEMYESQTEVICTQDSNKPRPQPD